MSIGQSYTLACPVAVFDALPGCLWLMAEWNKARSQETRTGARLGGPRHRVPVPLAHVSARLGPTMRLGASAMGLTACTRLVWNCSASGRAPFGPVPVAARLRLEYRKLDEYRKPERKGGRRPRHPVFIGEDEPCCLTVARLHEPDKVPALSNGTVSPWVIPHNLRDDKPFPGAEIGEGKVALCVANRRAAILRYSWIKIL
jgi:hypothetical protein